MVRTRREGRKEGRKEGGRKGGREGGGEVPSMVAGRWRKARR